MTESVKPFEARTENEKRLWAVAEAYGRKQTREELRTVFHSTYPSNEAQLAAIAKLLKENQ